MKQIKFQKILVTHDGSKLASAALPYANVLAAQLRADVTLLQVIPTVTQEAAALIPIAVPPTVSSPVPANGNIAREIVRDKVKKARTELEELKTALEKNRIGKVSIIVKQGNAPSTIVKVAQQKQCDLIVISTHGRSGFGRALLGSVADHVIRHAPCPVLVIHSRRKRQ